MPASRWFIAAGGMILVVGAAAAAYCAWQPDPRSGVRLAPDDPQMITAGASIYAAQCASCHGTDLEGQPDWKTRKPDGKLPAPPHDETGHTWHHTDAQLFELTKYGLPKEIGDAPYLSDMSAYEDILTDAEIIAVLSYIKSRWPADVRARHDEINGRARGG